jgi:hypothetical protein
MSERAQTPAFVYQDLTRSAKLALLTTLKLSSKQGHASQQCDYAV